MPEKSGDIGNLRFVPGDLYRGFVQQAQTDRQALAGEAGIITLGPIGLTILNQAVDWSQQFADDKTAAAFLAVVATALAAAPLAAADNMRRVGREVRLEREQDGLVQTFE